jgi:mannose-6-phosphate isomerase-like protein (cupin superfamily)
MDLAGPRAVLLLGTVRGEDPMDLIPAGHMGSRVVVIAAVAAVLGAAACGGESEPVAAPTSSPAAAPAPSMEWEAISVSEGVLRMEAGDQDTVTLIEKRAAGARLIRARPGVEDPPVGVLPNVTYHVVEGEGTLLVGHESGDGVDTVSLSRGTTAFVRGREPRAFRSASEQLLVVALFTTARPGLDDPRLRVFSRETLLQTKDAYNNVLHRAVEAESMTTGVYMLRREIGGDLLARHGVDEVKYVIRGGGTIEAGADVIPVEAGFVIFVDGSLTHRFTRLWRDLDVLFVWAR